MLKLGEKTLYSFEENIKNQIKENMIIFIPTILEIVKKLFFKYYYALYCFENKNSNENINRLNFQKLFDSELETMRQLLEYYLENCFDSKGIANETPQFNDKISQLDALMSKYNELVFFGRKNPYFANSEILPTWIYQYSGLDFDKELNSLWAQAHALFMNAKQALVSSEFDVKKCQEILEQTKQKLFETLSNDYLGQFDTKDRRFQEFTLTPDTFPYRLRRIYEENKDKILNLDGLK